MSLTPLILFAPHSRVPALPGQVHNQDLRGSLSLFCSSSSSPQVLSPTLTLRPCSGVPAQSGQVREQDAGGGALPLCHRGRPQRADRRVQGALVNRTGRVVQDLGGWGGSRGVVSIYETCARASELEHVGGEEKKLWMTAQVWGCKGR